MRRKPRERSRSRDSDSDGMLKRRMRETRAKEWPYLWDPTADVGADDTDRGAAAATVAVAVGAVVVMAEDDSLLKPIRLFVAASMHRR